MKKHQTLNTPEGALKVFSIYHDELRRHRFELNGKRILNIGSGNLIGLDALFLLYGAHQVISVDLSPKGYHYPDLQDQRPFFDKLGELVTRQPVKPPCDSWLGILVNENGRCHYNTERLHRITPCDASMLPLRDGCIDFAFSNAVLEHVDDPGGVITDITRVLSPEGHTMHRVDLRDHNDFSRPLHFLKPNEPKGGCNLWRASWFENAFRAQPLIVKDFEIFDTCKVTDEERASFVFPFSDLSCEELGKLRFKIYAAKTGGRKFESVKTI